MQGIISEHIGVDERGIMAYHLGLDTVNALALGVLDRCREV